ncbi:hypothetical protein [Enterovirga aerilata]|uniref:Uncharacterized protein n=1 Tax=Enterovirga aerilata TaxID=2730920 RepID=A0A849I441_9HYPH|nr:hypothetical protein [Enterovirga sp. DB1703]NNM74596.1 hypothetical protein [Enterovirga sp. DB1703]
MFGMRQSRSCEAAGIGLPVWAGRRLDQVETDELLGRIGSLREEIARVRGQLTRESIPEATLGALASALDHTARLITGGEGCAGRGRGASAVLARRLG